MCTPTTHYIPKGEKHDTEEDDERVALGTAPHGGVPVSPSVVFLLLGKVVCGEERRDVCGGVDVDMVVVSAVVDNPKSGLVAQQRRTL